MSPITQEWVKDFVDKTSKIAEEKRFFHWELEFPEVFFDRQGKKLDNPGFDVVVGNPPWVVSAVLPGDEVLYYHDTYLKSGDLYAYFIERMLGLHKSRFSFVCPRFFMFNRSLEYLRKNIIKNFTIDSLVDAGRSFTEVQSECMIFVFEYRSPKDPYVIRSERWNNSGQLLSQSHIQSDLFKKMPNFIFNVLLPVNWLTIIEKLKGSSLFLGKLCKSKRGLELGRGALVKDTGLPVMIGEEVSKYSCCLPGGVISKDEVELQRFTEELSAPWCIFVRRVGEPLAVTIDHKGVRFLKNLYALAPIYDELDPYFLISVLNSKLLSEFFKVYFTTKKEKLFPEVQKYQLDQLPIRRIYFTTPKEEREKLVEEGKKLYENRLKNGSRDPLLFFVDQRLKKQHILDPELVKKHNADPLNRDFQIKEDEFVEQSDVIHDLLAFLAEKMIEYNKEKNKEIKSFLGWLEREIGTKVKDLPGRTIIKKYHETTGDKLITILKKNKKKLQIDPARRDFQDRLSAEFDKSLQKLTPLKHKIEMTDRLIDQIVYKLYGLTEKEIKIAEKSFQK